MVESAIAFLLIDRRPFYPCCHVGPYRHLARWRNIGDGKLGAGFGVSFTGWCIMAVYEDTVSEPPETAPIAPLICRPRPPARLRRPPSRSGMAPYPPGPVRV